MWKCLGCGIQVEDELEICWSCGTDVDGVEDPNFERDDGEPDEAAARPVSGRLVTVAALSTSPQAHACKLRLEAGGVRAYLADDNLIAMDWLLSNAIGGVKVQVAAEDVE